MKIRLLFSFILLMGCVQLNAQDKSLPYYEIPSYPDTYTAANVAARLIDGVGFRYYWATEGLREQDLVFKPSGESRTTVETLTHIYELSMTVINATKKVPNITDREKQVLTFSEMRKRTLENLKAASDQLKASTDKDLSEYKMIFKNSKGTTEFPYWYQLNGPIADALWHIGQVVSLRRSSGNPFNSKVSVLQGKLIE